MATLAEEVCEVIEAAGFDPGPYSGRGMYGKQCVGFPLTGPSRADAFKAAIEIVAQAAAGEDAEKIFRVLVALRRVATDDLGLGAIIYFPRLAWKDAE